MKTLKMPPFRQTNRIPEFGRIYPGEWFSAGPIEVKRTYSALVFSNETTGQKVTIPATECEFPPDLEAKGVVILGTDLHTICARFAKYGAKVGKFTPKGKAPTNPERFIGTQKVIITAKPGNYAIVRYNHDRGIVERLTETGHGAEIVWQWLNQQLDLIDQDFFEIWAHIVKLGARPAYMIAENPYDAARAA